MNEQEIASKTFKQLRLSQKLIVVIFGSLIVLPPTIVQIFDLPPASWLISKESKMLGGYYLPQLTWLLLLFGNCLAVFALFSAIAIPVKLLTGKKLFQLFSKTPNT